VTPGALRLFLRRGAAISPCSGGSRGGICISSNKTIYDLPLRVTYYARVSTEKDEQAHSLKAQISYYEDFIRNVRGWTFISGYIDEGLSGTSVKKRGSFLRMVEDAKFHKFDFIITKEISRFSRNTLDSIQYTQKLLRNGVGVYFQSDNINTLMPDAELRLTIMSSIAQDEVRKISERVRFGFRRSIEKGVVLGNSRMWGYEKKDGKLIISEDEAKIVREIFDLYANERLGVRLICGELARRGYLNSNSNPFTFTTVRNIIANPKYKGYYCGGKTTKLDYRMNDRKHHDEEEWVMYKDEENVPPIVSEELWEKANRILSARSAKQSSDDRSSYNNKYTYSGKIWCMEHNSPYYRTLYRYKSGDKEVWQCKHFTEKGSAGCTSPILYTAELDQILRDCYNAIIQDKTAIINKLVKIYSSISGGSDLREYVAKTKVEIDRITAMKDKLLELSIEGRLSNEEFEKRNNSFNMDIERLEAQLANYKEQEEKNRAVSANVEALRAMIAGELDFKDGFPPQIAEALLEKVEVYKTDKKNEINLKVYFKVLPETQEYRINRWRGKASDCYRQYT